MIIKSLKLAVTVVGVIEILESINTTSFKLKDETNDTVAITSKIFPVNTKFDLALPWKVYIPLSTVVSVVDIIKSTPPIVLLNCEIVPVGLVTLLGILVSSTALVAP